MSGIHMMLLGAGGGAVSISNQTIEDGVVSPASADARYVLGTDGQAQSYTSGAGFLNISQEWWTAAPVTNIGNGYEARWTPISGTPSGAATNTWLALSTARTWQVTRSGLGSTTASGTVEIRDASSLTVLDSATITLTATVEA